MANICTNTLTVTTKGDDHNFEAWKQLREFVHAHQRIIAVSDDYWGDPTEVQEVDGKKYIIQDFCRSFLIPKPEAYYRPDGLRLDDPMFDEIMAWREENWGGALYESQILQRNSNKVVYEIDSKWTPISPYLAKIHTKFPLLAIENSGYGEMGESWDDKFNVE